MCVAAAIGGATIGSALLGADASKSAADTQASAQQQAAQTQLQMFNTINGQEQPFMQAGYGATTALNQLLGLAPGNSGNLPNGYLTQSMAPFDANTVTNSPGYQFAMKQGMQGVLNADTPAVGALSGPALSDLTKFASGTAAQYYNDYFNQYNTSFNQQQTAQNNIFSRLSGLAGLGQNAASNTGTAGTQLGTGASQAIAAAGGSQAAGTIGAANALSGGISSAGNIISLNNLLGSGGGFSNPGFGSGYSPATASGASAWGLGGG